LPFTDVPAGAYYEEAVRWAVLNGVTAGTGDTTFSPDAPCTRAQMVTFLWRAAGCPEPGGDYTPFEDVSADDYFAKAVAWAYFEEITAGKTETEFSPNTICTRAQMVAFLYRSQKQEAVRDTVSFEDVPENAYYREAVIWAVENGVTEGTSATTFSPDDVCTRAQGVTFLYRIYQ